MSDDLQSKTALVFDNGIFQEFAITLAKDFGRVLYHCPWEYGFSHVNDAMIGNGFDEIEWCDDPYDPDILKQVDIYCFPDIQHAGSQLLFEQMGKRVWGSRKADSLELLREKFKRIQKKIGMPVPEYELITGMSELRKYLSKNDDVYVKISRYRGSMETFHHVNMDLSDSILDELSVEFGGVKEHIPFVVEKGIKAVVETGYDGYCIDGQFPLVAVHGIEVKDKAYIGTIRKHNEMPDQVQEINQLIAPILKEYRYRNWWSTEIRVTEDGTPYFIDPTCREPSPAGESQLELYGNWGDIVWHGANGDLIEPEPVAEFAVQCVIEHNGEKSAWRTLEIPDKIRHLVKLRYACKVDDRYEIVPQPPPQDTGIGWAMGIGKTIEQAIDQVKDVAEQLSEQHLIIHTEGLVDAITAVKDEEANGMEFTRKHVPESSTVIN